MKKFFVLGFLISSALASAQPIDPVDPPHIVRETFINPTLDGIRFDICRTWATDCGKPAADAYCTYLGYTRSYGYTDADVDPRIGYTKLLTGEICHEPGCGGFKVIHCMGLE